MPISITNNKRGQKNREWENIVSRDYWIRGDERSMWLLIVPLLSSNEKHSKCSHL